VTVWLLLCGARRCVAFCRVGRRVTKGRKMRQIASVLPSKNQKKSLTAAFAMVVCMRLIIDIVEFVELLGAP